MKRTTLFTKTNETAAKNADLLGIPYRIVVSDKTLAEQKVEWKERSSEQTELITTKEANARLAAVK